LSERTPSLIVVSGPSGTGKSTVLQRVLACVEGLRFSVSHTTRSPRPGEREAVDYYFVSPERFQEMVDRREFLEWANVHDNRYGTARAEEEHARRDEVDLLLDLDVQGADQMRESHADAVSVFIFPPSYPALEERLRARGTPEDFLRRRLAAASEEASLYTRYDYCLVNDDLDRTVEQLVTIVRAARLRTSRADPLARRILATFPRKQGARTS
jgi:guanylate kinase